MCMQKEKSQVAMPQEAHRPHVELFRSSIKTTKKPSPASFKLEQSPGVSSSASVSVPAKQPRHSEHSTPPIQLPQPSGSRRSTINSLTAPTAVFGGRLPAPNSEIRIPDPPSRSPSPPTIVIPKGRGNKYTQEDRDFFIRFVGWRLKGDPSLTRNDICNLLAEKVSVGLFYFTLSHVCLRRLLIILPNLGHRIGQIIMTFLTRFSQLQRVTTTNLAARRNLGKRKM
jgi:hypothetical protein